MAADGMPFATGIGRATVVHVGTILVVIQSTRLGYTDGERMPGLDVLMLGQRRPNVSVVLLCEPLRPESMFYR